MFAKGSYARRRASLIRAELRDRLFEPASYRRDLVLSTLSRGKAGTVRLALVSDGLAYCSEEQFYPFGVYRDRLRRDAGVVTRRFRLSNVLRSPAAHLRGFDYVGLKLTYRTSAADAAAITRRIKSSLGPDTRLVYFDGDDDVCVQWPDVIAMSELYIKKHAFADRNDYLRTFAGKSNLHDFAHKVHGWEFTALDYGDVGDEPLIISESGPIAAEDIAKIVVSWNNALDLLILNLYREKIKGRPLVHERPFDVHFRGSVKLQTFTRYLRGPVIELMESWKDKFVLAGGSNPVPPDEYYNELLSSKICISPFGFGELCRRDFEAALCGALLVKPDMSHIETYPDIFVPGETYVPVEWDFSDLEEKIAYYLSHEAERRRIVENARRVLVDYYEKGGFVSRVAELFPTSDAARARAIAAGAAPARAPRAV